MLRRAFLLLPGLLRAQGRVYVCPMDPEVRSAVPGKCPRCGMKLISGAPEPVEYPLQFHAVPDYVPPDQEVTLEFRVLDPARKQTVRQFETVHEKLFHLFLVNQDLSYFAHQHPVLGADGWFRLKVTLPAGTYRLLADFDPLGATPQLPVHTFSTAGYIAPLGTAVLQSDVARQTDHNLGATIRMEPAQPLAGRKTMIFLHLEPDHALEPYLGAWAHLLAASADLVDMIHDHPFAADGGPELQFNLFFPREGMYRLWIQVQRQGIVNTLAFTLPVQKL